MTAPSTMTFDTLTADIIAYAERSVDSVFVDQVPRFVMQGEARIATEQKPLGYKRVVSGNFNGNTLVKPARWRLTGSFSFINSLNKRVYLKNRGYEWCRSFWPDASVTAEPIYYSDYDFETFFFAGTPNAQNAFELVYYERPEPLSSTTQTNWNTRYAQDALLYSCMIPAMVFLKNSERIPEFMQLYQNAIDSIAKEDASRLIDAGVARSK